MSSCPMEAPEATQPAVDLAQVRIVSSFKFWLKGFGHLLTVQLEADCCLGTRICLHSHLEGLVPSDKEVIWELFITSVFEAYECSFQTSLLPRGGEIKFTCVLYFTSE